MAMQNNNSSNNNKSPLSSMWTSALYIRSIMLSKGLKYTSLLLLLLCENFYWERFWAYEKWMDLNFWLLDRIKTKQKQLWWFLDCILGNHEIIFWGEGEGAVCLTNDDRPHLVSHIMGQVPGPGWWPAYLSLSPWCDSSTSLESEQGSAPPGPDH